MNLLVKSRLRENPSLNDIHSPDVDELEVGGLGESLGDADEERGGAEQRRQVDADDGLERLDREEVGAEGDDADEQRRHELRDELVQQAPAQPQGRLPLEEAKISYCDGICSFGQSSTSRNFLPH